MIEYKVGCLHVRKLSSLSLIETGFANVFIAKLVAKEEPLFAEGVMSSGVSMDLQSSDTMIGIKTMRERERERENQAKSEKMNEKLN